MPNNRFFIRDRFEPRSEPTGHLRRTSFFFLGVVDGFFATVFLAGLLRLLGRTGFFPPFMQSF